MNPRTTGLLALVACLLGTFVYLYEIEGEAGREAARETEKRLFGGIEGDDVDALELTTSDGIAARFERQGGAWRIVSPVEGAGDAVALDSIASALAQLPRAGDVEAAPGDLAQFGLGDAAQVVRFEAKGASRALRIGKATPVGANVYVATDAGPGIAYVEGYRVNAWKRALTDLRDRRIVAFEPGEVERLAIAWPEAGAPDGIFEVGLVRDGEKRWQIEKPAAMRADQETVDGLLSNLAYLQATGFVDERTPDVDAALRESALVLRWSLAGGEDEQRFRIAGGLDDARLVETTNGAIYRIAADRLEDFARRLAAYRDKQLGRLDPVALERIELEFSATPDPSTALATPVDAKSDRVVLEQTSGSWSVEGREADPEALAGLVASLASLRASDIVADGMGGAELASVGLASPAVRIRLMPRTTGADGAAKGETASASPLELELGRLDLERGLFARVVPEETIYVVAPSDAPPLTLADFEARVAKPAATPEPTEPIDALDPAEPGDSGGGALPDLLEQ
jgi:hypothetical protein